MYRKALFSGIADYKFFFRFAVWREALLHTLQKHENAKQGHNISSDRAMHYTFRYSTPLKVYTALCVMVLGLICYYAFRSSPWFMIVLYIAALFRPLYAPFDRG